MYILCFTLDDRSSWYFILMVGYETLHYDYVLSMIREQKTEVEHLKCSRGDAYDH